VAVYVQGHAAGIIAAVFEALQAFDENRGDVALGDGSDNATHGTNLQNRLMPYCRAELMK
jgi:hypothetical protein